MSLYRIKRIEEGERFSADDAWMVDFDEGFAVVPVEPDYEAAWGYARHESNRLALNERGDDLVALDKADICAVVDAALREVTE